MTKKFVSKRYQSMGSTSFIEANARASAFGDILDLSMGDPDIITDKEVIAGAFNDALKGYTRYAPPRGDGELLEEIKAYYCVKYGLKVQTEQLMVTASACHAMTLALEAIMDDGDEVIVPEPLFTPYLGQIKLARGVPVPLATSGEYGFLPEVDKLERAVTPKTKAILINTPNNPTGVCYSLEVLRGIAKVAIKHDLVVIADDIYDALSFQEPFAPIMGLEGMRERTVTINSFSKDFVMTGWRLGNIVAPGHIIDVAMAINEGMIYSAPTLSQRAAIYALRDRERIQAYIVEEYKKRTAYAAMRINAIPGMKVPRPQGTFYLFPSVKGTGLASKEFCDRLFDQAHVLAMPGSGFGGSGEGYVRLACTLGQAAMEKAFDRMEQFCKKIQA